MSPALFKRVEFICSDSQNPKDQTKKYPLLSRLVNPPISAPVVGLNLCKTALFHWQKPVATQIYRLSWHADYIFERWAFESNRNFAKQKPGKRSIRLKRRTWSNRDFASSRNTTSNRARFRLNVTPRMVTDPSVLVMPEMLTWRAVNWGQRKFV